MELITSHTHLDFDGLASAIAARILYPDSIISFPGRMNPDVRDFTSLYKDYLQLIRSSHIKKDDIQGLILVDCGPDRRIGEFFSLLEKKIPVIIYDHHQEEGQQIEEKNYHYHNAPVGAATTILVEEIQEKKFPITPFYATLFSLGIYSDTGSLRFPTTTYRDTLAITYLLQEGATLEVVDEFLRRPLSHEQQVLLNRLLEGGEVHNLAGTAVQIFTTSSQGYVPGLNRIVHELKNLTEAQVIITLVAFDRGVSILGRSKGDYIDLSSIFSQFGGGGHPGAAAAFVKGGQIIKVRKELFEIMKEKIKPPCTAYQIMSYPVHTIHPEQTMEEAFDIMQKLGHSGLVVIKDEELVGIISRRDMDKGRRHHLEHAPVKAFMSSSVLTIREDTPLHGIQKMMMENDVGRLPVLDREGRLIGIVTRSDILKNNFGQGTPISYRSLYGSTRVPSRPSYHQVKEQLGQLPFEARELLKELGELAHKMGASIYLIGGFVRDLLLGFPSYDLDLVIEGDSREYGRILVEELGGEMVKESQLGTIELKIGEHYHLDVAISRLEYYEEAGSLPQVQFATLEEDLFRRDFTINALALSLNPSQWGVLFDFFQGLKDLKEGKIRVLHNFSFMDDPLRILRGIRFGGRYAFIIEAHTKYLITASIEHHVLSKVSPRRLTHELILLFKEENIHQILLSMQELKVLEALFPGIKIKIGTANPFKDLTYSLKEFHSICPKRHVKPWLIAMMIFLGDLPENKLKDLLRCFSFNLADEKILGRIPHLRGLFNTLLQEERGSTIFKLLKDLKPEEMVFLYHRSKGVVRHRIEHFLQTLCDIKTSLTGKDLLALGLLPGPKMGLILNELKKGRLDGLFKNREEEMAYLKEYMKRKEINKGKG